ncbi:hypothetical protein JCM33374_g1324 [Metschnikowia sp. JCM 33374]|nr:hypothetical protein JCM33374_g1324 [Metschnikowia sp. JCM 33374]
MLGRLFKSKSSLNVSDGAGEASFSATPTPTQRDSSSEGTTGPFSPSLQASGIAVSPTNVNSFEDSYTREILYGSSELALHPLPFNPRRFRLVVAQDGGNLRTKQVLYDSANDISVAQPPPWLKPGQSVASNTGSALSPVSSSGSSSPPQSPCSENSRLATSTNTLRAASSTNLVAKQSHNINDINDYMFGRGLPSVEKYTSTKIHMLPSLNSSSNGASSAVLLTKLFSISDSSLSAGDTAILPDSDWVPRATFPSKETAFQISVPSSKSSLSAPDSALSPRSLSFSSRFSVGIIIPLEDANETVEEVLSSNWDTLSHYLIVLQKIASKKIIVALKNSLVYNSSPYIINKRISFPSGVLQSESEFGHQLQKLVKLVHYNVNTPRLVNINAFMTYSLNHMDSKLKTNVMNWALEVINWLEFKDGRNFSPLHAQGSAIPHMHSQNSYLSHSSSSVTSWYRSNETPVSSNTFLASLFALILPLRASLSESPLHVDPTSSSDSKCITRVVVMTSNSSVAKKLIFILSGLIPDAKFLERLEHEGNTASYERCVHDSDSSGTDESLSGSGQHLAKDKLANNLDRGTAESPHDGGISFTAKPIPAKPIPAKPIPIRTSTMVSESPSDDSTSVSVSSTKGWDVPHKSATSLSLNSHKNHLDANNVTVAQQIPNPRRVSASNTSSMAYLSSSLNSSLSSSASNYSLSRLGSSFMDKWRNSLVGSNKLNQTFISETLDGAITSDTLGARPPFTSTKSPSPSEEIEEPIWEDSYSTNCTGSPMKQKFSRTQSLLNLFNEIPNKKNGISTSTLGVDRTRTSIYVPPMNNEGTNADDTNSKIIRRKVSKIMSGELHYTSKDEKRLVVDVIDTKNRSIRRGESFKTLDGRSTNLQYDNSRINQLHKKSFLQHNVAFVDEFRPEYTIQSCPVNPRLEAQVSNAMKNDLLFYQNNCGYEKVTSKTVYISLRAREIKVIEMNVGNQKRGYFGKGHVPSVSPAAVADQANSYFSSMTPNSPSSPYFNSNDHGNTGHDKRDAAQNANSFRTTVKKVYTPNRNTGDKDVIQQVEAQLEKLNEVASLINSNAAESADTKDLYNRMLFNAVRELIS